MWPLHIRSKDEYMRLIQAHLDASAKEPLSTTLEQAFEDYIEEEGFAAWCASVAWGSECDSGPTLVARFLERYPLSMHPIQIDYGESLMWQGRVDEASNEARAYLNRAQEMGMTEAIHNNDQIRDGCSRAFLLLTAVYTEVGARSYSRRIVEHALLMGFEPYWQQRYKSEHRRIAEELRDAGNASLDRTWEEFFATGRNEAEVVDLAQRCKCVVLAKRLQTIARMMRDEPGWRPGDEEIFQMLYQTDKGAFVLS